jgi:hypothetical protein
MSATKKVFRKHIEPKIKRFEEVFEWMVKNNKTPQSHEEFDCPEYGGMPKKLSRKLSSDFVDLIQDNWDWIQKNKSIKRLCELFFYS